MTLVIKLDVSPTNHMTAGIVERYPDGMARYALNRMQLQWLIPVRLVRDDYLLYGECESRLQPYTYLLRS